MAILLMEVIDTFKALAIAEALTPGEESIYRSLCRKYSMLFHTPLPQVLKLEPQHVIQNVFEHQIGEIDLDENMEKMLEMIYQIEDPDYSSKVEEDLEDFAAMAEMEEEERIRTGGKIGRGIKPPGTPAAPKVEVPKEELPKEGGINLAYLSNSKDER